MQSFNDVRTWEDEQQALLCRKCKAEFGMLTWKHHCRACGKVFCDFCSCFYRSIPESELCPGAPDDMVHTDPQRCCEECSERIKQLEAEQRRLLPNPAPPRQHIHEYNVIQTVDSLELIHGRATNLYTVQLPAGTEIYAEQTIRVELDGAVNHIIIPYGVGPGDVLHVRANVYPNSTPNTHNRVVTDVLVVNTEQVAPVPQRPPTVYPTRVVALRAPPQVNISNDAFIECPACTYRNLLQAETCAMCEADLVD